jgi:hypothetical protein
MHVDGLEMTFHCSDTGWSIAGDLIDVRNRGLGQPHCATSVSDPHWMVVRGKVRQGASLDKRPVVEVRRALRVLFNRGEPITYSVHKATTNVASDLRFHREDHASRPDLDCPFNGLAARNAAGNLGDEVRESACRGNKHGEGDVRGVQF